MDKFSSRDTHCVRHASHGPVFVLGFLTLALMAVSTAHAQTVLGSVSDTNVAVGVSALQSNTTGTDNTASGHQALTSNTEGIDNTAAGSATLFKNTTGSQNTAIGRLALHNNVLGSRNTASGHNALWSNADSSDNVAIGASALYSNNGGGENVAVGNNALAGNSVGSQNTALGHAALIRNVEGAANTAVGLNALLSNTNGSSNTALGYEAGINATGSNNIFIGNVGVAGESSTTRIGSIQTRVFVNGIRGVTTGVADAVSVMIDSSGQLGTISSSRRYKEDISDMAIASEPLLNLRPVTFRYKKPYANGEQPIQYGLIAEEVAEQFPDLVVYSADGQVETVKYQLLSVLLLNELQKQQVAFQQQSELNELQEIQLTRQETRLAELQTQSQEIATLKAQLADLQGLRDTVALLMAERPALLSQVVTQ